MISFLQFGRQPPTPSGVVPILKGELRMINMEVLKLRPEQKKVTVNMTSFLQFERQPPRPSGVVPIPKGELRMINMDPHHQQEKGLVHVPTPQGKIMWVHPDLVDSQQ